MTSRKAHAVDAAALGGCSLATQAVYLRLILSSPAGGELYAALALGGWLWWVGLGSFLGRRIRQSFRPQAWLYSALIKLPLALLIFVYPSFFLETLDPLRFLPLAVAGMALPGMLYGMIFGLLISPDMRASIVYRNEAVGSVIGGILVTIWALVGLGDFGLLVLLSLVELSRFWGRFATSAVAIIVGPILGVTSYHFLDSLSLKLRWPGFQAVNVAHGFSGLWSVISRENQLTIVHGGGQIASIPDRASSEEALLWPLIFKPDTRNLLLIGYEGIQTSGYLPEGVKAVRLVGDQAYLKLGISDSSNDQVSDPLSFSYRSKFDIVSVRLQGAGSLYDYRLETELLVKRCLKYLESHGMLFVSAPSQENYVSPLLGQYLSGINGTLAESFAVVRIIPGSRVGFACFRDSATAALSDPVKNLRNLDISSPYFNEPLVANRLLTSKSDYVKSALDPKAQPNSIFRPSSVVRFLKWQGSQFGKKGWIFNLYAFPYIVIVFFLIPLVPLMVSLVTKSRYAPVFGVSNFGFLGMAFEIAILYLFQMIYGTLYLHIGMIMAVFMVGLAVGSGLSHKLKPAVPFLISFLGCLLMLSFPALAPLQMTLLAAGTILYILSLIAGLQTGSGFAIFANRGGADAASGAALYGADLLGALVAAVFGPGLIISLGITGLGATLFAVSLANLATLKNMDSISQSSL